MALEISGFKAVVENYDDKSQLWWYVKPKSERLKTVILSFDTFELELDVSSDFSDLAIAKTIGLSIEKQFFPIV